MPLFLFWDDEQGLPRWRSALPEGHDVAFHAIVGHQYLRALSEGVLVPRWVEPIAGGLGSPVFGFYPPLSYNVTRALDGIVPGGTVTALKATAAASSVLSLIAVFALARDRLSTFPSLGVVTVYALASSRAIDLHERFALPTHAAYVWLPLIVLLADRLARRPGHVGGVLALAVACAGLLLTHTLSAMLVFYGLLPYGLWRLLRAERRGQLLLGYAGAAVLAALLSAVLLAPLAFDADLVDSEWIRESPHGQYERNFLWSDEEELGFTPAVIKPRVETAALSLGALTLVALVVSWSRRSRGVSEQSGQGSARVSFGETAVLAGVASWLLLLQTALTAWLWSWAPGLSWVQFPWRFGALATLVVSLLIGHALAAVSPRPPGRRAQVAVLAVLGLVLLLLPVWREWPTNSLRNSDDLDALAPRLIVEEYLPQRIEPQRVEGFARTERARLVGGSGRADEVRWGSQFRQVDVTLDAPATLVLRTFFHPGWRATVDGAAVELVPHPERGVELLALTLDAGESSVELRYVDTAAGRAGRWVSLAAWLLLLVLLGRSLKHRTPRAPRRSDEDSSLDVAESA